MEKKMNRNRTIMIMFAVLAVLLLGGLNNAQTPVAESSKTDKSTYRQMVQKARNGDLSVNFGELRKAYVQWLNDGNGTKEAPHRDEMVRAFQAKNFAKAIELGEVVIDYEFVNDGLLGAIGDAYQKSGNEQKAKWYSDLSHNVRHGLFLSGDGKTAKTAYYVMNIDEEYRVMRAFDYSVSVQSLMRVDGQSYDLLAGKDDKGKTVELYFNICAFFSCGPSK